MSGAPARGTVPRRQRRHHHRHHHHHHHHHHQHRQKHQKHVRDETPRDGGTSDGESEEKRPKVNPIFLWASQREQRIVEVRCEDYDKRNRIKLTKTAQGWRSIPRTTSNVYTIALQAAACKTRTSADLVDSPVSSVSSNDEKENGKRRQETAPQVAPSNSLRRLPRKYPANGATNGLLTGVQGVAGKKRRYNDAVVVVARNDEARRGYSYSRDGISWNAAGQGCTEESNGDEGERRKSGEMEKGNKEDRLSSLRNKHKLLGGRVNLERLQKDKLFQPRVVLEQLHLSQLPESVHRNVVLQTRVRSKDDVVTRQTKLIEENDDDNERDDEEDVVGETDEEEEEEEEEDEEDGEEEKDEEEVEEEENNSKRRVNKADIRDILNMIDATASPVLATDTPSADLPVDSTKTYENVLDANDEPTIERKVKERACTPTAVQSRDDARDRSRGESMRDYQTDAVQDDDGGGDDVYVDEKLEVHEEKILEDYPSLEVEGRKIIRADDKLVLLSLKSNRPETMLRSCKIAEADGGLATASSRPTRRGSLVAWSSTAETLLPETGEEEAPDEPGEPIKFDYNDSSKILDALRNTPGLSVSVTRNHIPEIGKVLFVSPARPPSKASSSSRSPDSQAECVEKLLKNNCADSATAVAAGSFHDVNRGRTNSPRNLPGLSIVIPNYRYRNVSGQLATTSSPNAKRRVESPESTVSFNKADTYSENTKLDGFPHEEEEEEEYEDEDCDSQVLEDLRRQRADSLAYDSVDTDYYNNRARGNNLEDRKTPLDNAKADPLWTNVNRNSEAQAKCKYQEHLDEQVFEELRSRGTVVSPQPSGIPCSPASRRPSSAYLERLLPSPPCSVSCSEDAKSELTLKSILTASSSCIEPRDYERESKEGASMRFDRRTVEPAVRRDRHSTKGVDRNDRRRTSNRSFQERSSIHGQEAKNSGRPMSSGDIRSNYYATTERVAPKRPMSAEWATGRRERSQHGCQKSGRARNYFAEHHRHRATSSSTDRLLDPASQLRELIDTAGHLIPDPLLVPRDCLPALAAAPATEIPKLLTTRPELRLPEALTRPDLLRDPDLLVISLAHLQHVLDHGEGPVSRSRQSQTQRSTSNGGVNRGSGAIDVIGAKNSRAAAATAFAVDATRPMLSCKPIGTLMPAPMDLSNGRTRVSPCPPLLRVRSGLLKQEPEVSSTASSPDESQLWHPLFGSQKRQQHQQQQSQQRTSWHRTTLAS